MNNNEIQQPQAHPSSLTSYPPTPRRPGFLNPAISNDTGTEKEKKFQTLELFKFM
jgi:hypothetical protein